MKHGHFLLSKFWHEGNIAYFYEFFDLFDTVNLSFCYQNIVTKPEFGPYHGPSDLITLQVFRFYCHMILSLIKKLEFLM